tara:strand:- start:128 stop:256 length:129 start_codon:yes stop_codon:yes gene_type:complete
MTLPRHAHSPAIDDSFIGTTICCTDCARIVISLLEHPHGQQG